MLQPSVADDNTATARAVSRLLEWYGRSARELPWRTRPEPYGVWISEVMLQQTRVAAVVPYWLRWMNALPTPAALAAAGEEQVLKLWEGLGYYARARNLKKAAEIIMTRHHGRFPSALAEVRALPGVGDYTAGAVCSIAFNQPAPAVDGNVVRVLTRALGIEGDPKSAPVRDMIWEAAGKWMQAARRKRTTPSACAALTQALMELGATVCLPGEPECVPCPLRRQCFARRENRTRDFPQNARRAAAVPRRFVVLVVERGPCVLVRQRPAGTVNGGLWEFPNFELPVGDDGALEAVLGKFARFKPSPLTRFTHSITKYRVTLEVFRGKSGSARKAKPLQGVWLDRTELGKPAFAGAHRKIARLLA